ncbi:MAG: GTPase HflX [Candidatus Eiseniibacteriota bacterium]
MLVGVATGGLLGGWKESLEELGALVDTAGAQVVTTVVQPHGRLNPRTLVTKGKAREIKEEAGKHQVDLVVVDHDLSPAQQRNLEELTGRKVVDRSMVILDIFAFRARTHEARIQVELAQLEYVLPRLTRMWQHLSRTGGGIGTRGPGETQLEVDRRRVREKIAILKRRLARVERERTVQRKRRQAAFRIALVGYTNAGKSTLFNALTRSEVFTEDRLFATLDATTRKLVLPGRHTVLVSDTVGFIRNLPHHLVASFRSTLAEVIEADLLIHVVDASSAAVMQHIASVHQVLEDLDCLSTPRVLVFNKIDLMDRLDVRLMGLRASHPGSLAVSSLSRQNLDRLVARTLDIYREARGSSGALSYLDEHRTDRSVKRIGGAIGDPHHEEDSDV